MLSAVSIWKLIFNWRKLNLKYVNFFIERFVGNFSKKKNCSHIIWKTTITQVHFSCKSFSYRSFWMDLNVSRVIFTKISKGLKLKLFRREALEQCNERRSTWYREMHRKKWGKWILLLLGLFFKHFADEDDVDDK